MKERIHNTPNHKHLRTQFRNDPTTAERILWKYIRNSQLGYKFRRQQGIGNYIVDFYCPEIKMIIEMDGSIHGEKENIEHDKERQTYLESNGFTVLRYRNEQIKYDRDAVLQDIKNNCDNAINHPQPLLSKEGRSTGTSVKYQTNNNKHVSNK